MTRRFRHQMRQEQRPQSPPPTRPRNPFPPDMLDQSFKSFMARMFPTAAPDSNPYKCMERAWYFGLLFYKEFTLSLADIPEAPAMMALHAIEQQLQAYMTATMKGPKTDEQPAADSGADSGTNSTATDNPGEQDAGNKEQSGGEDASGPRDA